MPANDAARDDLRSGMPVEAPRNAPMSLLLSTHPVPGVAVTIIAVVLGIAVGLDPWRIAVLGVAVLANQWSVGLSNDWLDADRDRAVGRRDKPVARGWIAPSTVRNAAFVTGVAALVITIPLGVAATIAHAVFLLCAWGYNLGLKSTAFSVVPYIVGFGLLPMVVTLALPVPAVAAGWVLALGALLGIAAHFANVLPDLSDDEATGIRGLPHRLGMRTSGVVTYLVLGTASVLAFIGPRGAADCLQTCGLMLGLALSVTGIVLVLTRPPGRVLFGLIIAAALVDVALLAIAGQQLMA